MDKMKLYSATLGYHVTGKLSESAEKDVKDAPFDGGHPSPKQHKDAYGNVIKTKNLAKHLAKKGLKSVTEEDILEALSELDDIYEMAIELQDVLEEVGINFEELFAIEEDAEEVDENFQKMSKTKQLIARRRAGRSKKLTPGYHINRQAKPASPVKPIQKK